MENKVIIDDALDMAIDGVINFVDEEFEIQEAIEDAIPANEQIRDVAVLTVVKAVDKVLEAKEIDGVRGLSSMRGGVSVIMEDYAPDAKPCIYPAINPDLDKMGDTLAFIIQEIADMYGLDIKEVAEAIEDTEMKIPVGFGNDAIDNKTITDYVMDI